MNTFKHGRYSGYIRPISYLIDLTIINGLGLLFFFKEINPLLFLVLISAGWVTLSLFSKFYEVYRYTREVTILALIFRQLVLFTLLVFSFSGYYHEFEFRASFILKYVLLAFVLITIFKFSMYYFLQQYRSSFGGNMRRTVIFGNNKQTKALENFFNNNPEYGYSLKKTLTFKDNNLTI